MGILGARKNRYGSPSLVGALLLANGLLKSLKFGEAYLSPYMVEVKGVTLQDVNDKVFPVWTYSYLVFLLPVALLSRYMGGYRGLVYLEASMDILTYAILTWFSGLGWMQFMQVTYGLSTAASIGYFASVAACLPEASRQKWNAILRAGILFGHVIGSLASHLILYLGADMQLLYLLSFISLILALLISFFFPAGLTFEPPTLTDSCLEAPALHSSSTFPKIETPDVVSEESTTTFNIRQFLRALKASYASWDVIIIAQSWSFVFASLCLSELYMASVWPAFSTTGNNADYVNGIMDAVGRSVGALGSLLGGYVPIDSNRPRLLFMSMIATYMLMAASILFIQVIPNKLILTAISYCVMMLVGYSLVTVLTGILGHAAKSPYEHSLVLGTQTFISMLVQTILLACMSSESLPLATRYYAFAGIMLVPILLTFICLFILPSRSRLALKDPW